MTTKQSLKQIYSKNFFIFLGVGFLPLVWKILEIALLSGFDNAINILGQLALINIIFKVFEETLLNPLYKTLSKNNFKTDEQKNAVAKKFLWVYIFITFAFTVLVFLLNRVIAKISCVPNDIFDKVIVFFNIYIFACGFGFIAKFLYTFNIINKDTKKMFIYFISKAFGTALLLLVFVPKFSLALGVNGVAIAELIVNVVTTCYLLITFPKTQKQQIDFDKQNYLKLTAFSFLETIIRNVVYYCVILVVINMLNNQDLYYVSNDYIWSFMLVPTLAQSTLVRQDIASNPSKPLKAYFINCLILLAFMGILTPFAMVVFKYIYALPNYLEYFYVLLKLLPFYIIFVFDSVIES